MGCCTPHYCQNPRSSMRRKLHARLMDGLGKGESSPLLGLLLLRGHDQRAMSA